MESFFEGSMWKAVQITQYAKCFSPNNTIVSVEGHSCILWQPCLNFGVVISAFNLFFVSYFVSQVHLQTAPADFRFPSTNQTRHCFTRYIEFHRYWLLLVQWQSSSFMKECPIVFRKIVWGSSKAVN